MTTNRYLCNIQRLAVLVLLTVAGTAVLQALPVEHYATSSRLATGRWRKVEVTQTGMQLLTTAMLRSMGFTNPEKVNVYGYGGRKLSDLLNTASYIDDLPMQPVVRTDAGIIFYGVNTVTWNVKSVDDYPYDASMNHYSSKSFYFISDVEPDSVTQIPVLEWQEDPMVLNRSTTFLERLVHEVDLAHPLNSGEWWLGEDFTQQTSHEFKFELPGHADSVAGMVTTFGTHTIQPTKFLVKVNDRDMPEKKEQTIQGRQSDENFINLGIATHQVSDITDAMKVSIEYVPTGIVYFARLSSIKVYYNRRLEMTNGLLSFHSLYTYNPLQTYEISGASATTQIWDVTNPAMPKRINYTLKDNKAIFTTRETEYHEFVAFEPSAVKKSPQMVAAAVTNQDVHSVATPDMVIISPREYLDQARRIGEMHDRVDGMDTYIVTPEALYNEFSSGSPDITAYRKALKMWYDRTPGKLKYCLLLGRPSYDPRQISTVTQSAGYPRTLTWQEPGEHSGATEETEINSSCTDDYIAMLDDNPWSFNIYTNNTLNIALGRMPFRSVTHATQMVDKLIKYVENPSLGAWRNTITMLSDNGDRFAHFDQTNISHDRMLQNGGSNFLYEKIHLSGEKPTNTSLGREYPLSKQRMLQMLDRGTGLFFYIGHGNPRELTHEHLFTYTDICEMSNRYMPIFYTSTCELTRWDADEVSAGEIMWSHPESGAIGMLSTSRSVQIGGTGEGEFSFGVARNIFGTDSTGKALGIGEVMRRAKNYVGTGENRLLFVTLGDPAMRVINPRIEAVVDEIDGIDPSTLIDPDFPVYKGGSKVNIKGSIRRGENVARDFDGMVHLTLYDAERVMKTQDPDTATRKIDQRLYNIRTNKVYEGLVKVTGGRWEASIPVTMDIENNFSPASLTMYAYSNEGMEANGAFSSLYLYGMEENLNDTEGPAVTGMGLNTYNFKPGSQVDPNPVFYAAFSDPSGINLASSGVGHEMIINIDNKTYFTNIRDYYMPSADYENGGTVTYPLSDLEPGPHTLEFSICDNLGNQTRKTLDFIVTVSPKPIIYEVIPDCNPARTSVTFSLVHNRLAEATECSISVYDLSGRKVWTGELSGKTDLMTGPTIQWDLCDGSGRRVPRGIYLYRATVESADGVAVSKTGKLAVTEK